MGAKKIERKKTYLNLDPRKKKRKRVAPRRRAAEPSDGIPQDESREYGRVPDDFKLGLKRVWLPLLSAHLRTRKKFALFLSFSAISGGGRRHKFSRKTEKGEEEAWVEVRFQERAARSGSR